MSGKLGTIVYHLCSNDRGEMQDCELSGPPLHSHSQPHGLVERGYLPKEKKDVLWVSLMLDVPANPISCCACVRGFQLSPRGSAQEGRTLCLLAGTYSPNLIA